MTSKQKSEIKISLWEEEVKNHEAEVSYLKGQIEFFKGFHQAFVESLELLNNQLRSVKLAVQWDSLSEIENKK